MSKLICTVMWALAHNGNEHQAGDEIEIDSSEAESLLQSGVIQLVDDSSDVISLDDIVMAIDELGDDDYTGNGIPEVKALERVLDGNITAEQRDNAWSEYNK